MTSYHHYAIVWNRWQITFQQRCAIWMKQFADRWHSRNSSINGPSKLRIGKMVYIILIYVPCRKASDVAVCHFTRSSNSFLLSVCLYRLCHADKANKECICYSSLFTVPIQFASCHLVIKCVLYYNMPL